MSSTAPMATGGRINGTEKMISMILLPGGWNRDSPYAVGIAIAKASKVETMEVERVNERAYATLCELNADTRLLGFVHDRTENRAIAERMMKRTETDRVASLKI